MENSRLAKIVETAKGERSIREYSADSGVNPTTISKIISKGYIPSSGILKRLASPEAKPRGNVTLQDMMIAAGYSDDYIKPDYLIMGDNGDTILVEAKNRKELDEQAADRLYRYSSSLQEYRQAMQRFEAVAAGAIYGALALRGIRFTAERSSDLNRRGYFADIFVELSDGPVRAWQFDFRKFRNEQFRKQPRMLWATRLLGRYILLPPDRDKKLSIVLDDEEIFDALMEYKGKLSYKGDLSVILIDTMNVKAVREEYIAFYDDDPEKGRQIRLV